MAQKRKKNQYVNNKDFLAAMEKYTESVKESKQHNLTRPRVPDYIGECIMKIATHLSQKPNFANYTFREEMILDGIENCLQYIDNFNPEKSKNPFAYFTQIIYYAFLRRIQKEKKMLYVKYKLTEEINLQNLASDRQEHDINQNFNDQMKFSEWTQEHISTFIEEFEATKRRKVKKKKQNEDSVTN